MRKNIIATLALSAVILFNSSSVFAVNNNIPNHILDKVNQEVSNSQDSLPVIEAWETDLNGMLLLI